MNRRLRLLAAAAPLTMLAAPATAQISTETTAPVNSSTINGGAPGDVVITQSGAVRVTGGAAVTIDSDNDLDNQGIIENNDADDAVGVRVVNGVSGDIANSGSINLNDTTDRADADGDGDLDGPWSTGQRRVGILIEGGAPFVGDVRSTDSGAINVEGDDSAGIRTEAQIDGDLAATGTINTFGDNTFGVDIQNGVTGDVRLGGSVSSVGDNAVATSVMGDVGGGLSVMGGVRTSGFREASRRATAEQRALLDADDLLNAGPAIAVGGSLGEGLTIAGPAAVDDPATPADETLTPGATVQTFGSSPSVLVSAAWDAARATDVVLSPVPGSGGYGLVNRGVVQGAGVNDGYSATALRIEGAGGLRAIVDGGVFVSGAFTAAAFDADATGIDILAGGETPAIHISSSGGVNASTSSDGDDTATAISVAAGASVAEVINDGTIIANATDGPGATYAILDASGTLLLVENAGAIRAVNTLPDGSTAVPGDQVAIDLSAATAASVVRQVQRSVDDDDPDIRGDIRLGSGDDTVDLDAGFVDGDIAFGAGADTLSIDGGATLSGRLSDSDGALTVAVNDGSLILENTGDVAMTSFTLGSAGRLEILVDATSGTPTAPRLLVSGGATIADGGRIAPRLLGVTTSGATFEIINAGALTAPADIADVVATELPFIYAATLGLDPGNANIVLLTVEPRTAAELGMNPNQAAAYPIVLASLGANVDVGSALANLATGDEFFAAYDQLFPNFSDASLQMAVANLDGAIGAVGTRLDAVRGGREGSGGVWISEYGTYQDRDRDVGSPGWRGRGFGFAAGVDRPFGPLYALGVNVSTSAHQWSEPSGFDDPISSISAHAGVYAAAQAGGLLIDAYGGAGGDFYESRRDVRFATLSRQTTADWTGYHANASLRAAYEITAGRAIILPTVSLDYLHLSEDSYSETGGGAGIDLEVGERTSDNVAATAILIIGGRFNRSGNTWWSPRVRLGYRSDLGGETPVTMARFVGSPDYFMLTADELPNSGVVAGFTFAAGSDNSSFAFDYDADVRDGYLRHVARVAFRFVF